MTGDVVFSKKGQLGIIKLNRPDALNALTLPMIQAIQKQLEIWKEDASISAVVVKAAAGKAFCAGGDIRRLYECGEGGYAQQMSFFEQEYRLNHFIHQFPKPYIALMDGITMGGGVGISLHGAFPVATERFIFAMPETGIGFFPDIGASYLLSKCSHNMGVFLGLTGKRLDANESMKVGLVHTVIPSEHQEQVIEALSEIDLSEESYHRVESCIQTYAIKEPNQESRFDYEIISECFSRASIESMMSDLQEKNMDWTRDLFLELQNKSPTSLKVTLEQIHRAQGKSLLECLQTDYVLASHFMKGHDFYEGIRALLVDKDKSPQWQPDRLENVTEVMIAEYFEPDIEFVI